MLYQICYIGLSAADAKLSRFRPMSPNSGKILRHSSEPVAQRQPNAAESFRQTLGKCPDMVSDAFSLPRAPWAVLGGAKACATSCTCSSMKTCRKPNRVSAGPCAAACDLRSTQIPCDLCLAARGFVHPTSLRTCGRFGFSLRQCVQATCPRAAMRPPKTQAGVATQALSTTMLGKFKYALSGVCRFRRNLGGLDQILCGSDEPNVGWIFKDIRADFDPGACAEALRHAFRNEYQHMPCQRASLHNEVTFVNAELSVARCRQRNLPGRGGLALVQAEPTSASPDTCWSKSAASAAKSQRAEAGSTTRLAEGDPTPILLGSSLGGGGGG